MEDRTIRALNALNHDFYGHHAAAFCATRQRPWPGWQGLLPHLVTAVGRSTRPRILDAGAGNGRFLRWLASRTGTGVAGIALDNSLSLLCRQRSEGPARRLAADLVADAWPLTAESCDGVVLMGVLHHVPSFERRCRLLRLLAATVRPTGVLVATAWQFADHERFRARSEPPELAGLAAADLEEGDHLLRWGPLNGAPPALRYCHHTSAEELRALAADAGLETVAAYRSDGASGDMNLYRVWRRQRGFQP